MRDHGKPNVTPRTPLETQDWRALAERAAEEKDPQKLIELVQTLCDQLDALASQHKGTPSKP